MGWVRVARNGRSAQDTIDTLSQDPSKTILKYEDAVHVEVADITPSKNNETQYPFHPVTLSVDALPYIEPDVVRNTKGDSTKIWLVIDSIVYDCTSFVNEHPGGESFITSFQGEDCSWQFKRFHSSAHMKEFGQPLRIGRTSGICNRFKERPRLVGLRGFNRSDEW
ncbi:hypothetical protein B0A48_02494 [Cryoendolithus antarcticus]|uniref:Cytochrome b5 heme-binding domain-containing protein n=1 Tax=Cryoendolithus antarcticus TaxID=1507870 RepID=A0A1V8TNT3_9PEZI|nr:hypothetical protein B0A48_02494 [Cryoendolithus antarcticus]